MDLRTDEPVGERRADILGVMRAYLSRPSAVHEHSPEVMWRGNAPVVRRDLIDVYRMDDVRLIDLYQKACRRAVRA